MRPVHWRTPMVRGVVTSFLLFCNMLLWGIPVLLSGIPKLFLPGARRRDLVRWVSRTLAAGWVAGNNWIFDRMLSTRWEVRGLPELRYDARYLIISNHASWVDIFAVARTFHRRTAFLRFFLKQQLIWFPVAGQACWVLDFPFMRRYSPELLERHPEKRGRDLETTRIACRKYRKLPVAILNFAEGTRFTREKHADQQSPYAHLLRPRLGGIGFVLASLGDQLDGTLDVTVAYPGVDVTMWDFVCNRVPRVVVTVRTIEVPHEFMTGEVTEPGPVRDRFRDWMDELWRGKDAILGRE